MAIERILVIGAGTMGHGIGHAAAVGGYTVTIQDVSPASLDKARAAVEKIVQKGVELGKTKPDEAQKIIGRLSFTPDREAAARQADLIIEAAPEQIAIKMEIFAGLDRMAPESAIFASNTSALSITEMAGALSRPARLVGMHFFNPVHKMKLVEVIRALESSPAAIEAVTEVARRMGKETVLVRESPGFVTSRVNAMIGNEAFCMLQEGVASAPDIDKALKLGLNHPMGPFELVDLVGLDTRLSVLEFLHKTLGEKYRPCPLLVQYVKAGRLGRKVGKGVFEYPEK
ncbi:MAG: 3-hydroxyacyl-CoA dehydrogenase [Planctomycetes bacterium]|nr:3-hydroxyacyl-CoA dehydrogenase [Planctomycetota bacterium]